MTTNILRIDASARRTGSITRKLADQVVSKFETAGPTQVTTRDLANGLPLIDEAWVGANFTAPSDRTPEQVERLALSDQLVAELQAADTVVIGLPMYNFGAPAALKAWIDLVARAGDRGRYVTVGPG